jgi:hypothetical protein
MEVPGADALATDSPRSQSCYRHRTIDPASVTQLAVGVLAPTPHAIVDSQCTGMRAARGYFDSADEVGYHRRSDPVGQGAIPNLSESVGSEALDPSIRREKTGMTLARRHSLDVEDSDG